MCYKIIKKRNNKVKAKGRIGDNDGWQNGMGMLARNTFNTVNRYFVSLHMAIYVADKGSGIAAIDIIIAL